MGQNICRFVLLPSATKSAAETLARNLSSKVERIVTIYFRDLEGKRARTPELQDACAAAVRIVDIAPPLSFEVLKELGTSSFGENNFLLRVADDEELDQTYPSSEWLTSAYPQHDLDWLLDPEEDPIPWNTSSFYLFPNNPATWDLEVPLFLSLLNVALPNQTRPCPFCKSQYTSKGERGQCNACGFVAQPFQTKDQAKTILPVRLDAFAWGSCPRCRRSREFVHQVEQCFRCGQLMEANPGKHAVPLQMNKGKILELLKDAGIF